MAHDIQIQCINKDSRNDIYRRVTHIGGVDYHGYRWTLTLEEAIDGVINGTWRFWIASGDERVAVDVATSAHGDRYLKAEADGDEPNNLLSLPECPLADT